MKNITLEGYPVMVIDRDEQLARCAEQIRSARIIAFDTEFDRFRRQYGFNLELIQIFDGTAVYLIRTISLKDLLPLKPVFENSNVCKLVYSGSEDIQALKIHKINPHNVYDLQIASKLCNCRSNSLAGLVEELLNVTYDKSKQKSNWSKPDLDLDQITYAAKDVFYLISIFRKLETLSDGISTGSFIEEENAMMLRQKPSTGKFTIRNKLKADLSEPQRQLLYKLFELRDDMARERNRPPHFIFPEMMLREIAVSFATFQGICKLKECPSFYLKNTSLAASIDRKIRLLVETVKETPPSRPQPGPIIRNTPKIDTGKLDNLHREFTEFLEKQFGAHSAEYIASGVRGHLKLVLNGQPGSKYPEYRQRLLHRFLEENNLAIDSLRANAAEA